MIVSNRNSDFLSLLTVVYGKNTTEERKRMWEGLLRVGSSITIPWCLCGDFNTPLTYTNMIGAQNVAGHEIKDFLHVMESLKLTNMKSTGRV